MGSDEFIWQFNDSNVITIKEDMQLFSLLKNFMNNNYEFNNNKILNNYKDDIYLRWFSDTYYNPEDPWSILNVSYLNLKYSKDDNSFKIWCIKPLYQKLDNEGLHAISFYQPEMEVMQEI